MNWLTVVCTIVLLSNSLQKIVATAFFYSSFLRKYFVICRRAHFVTWLSNLFVSYLIKDINCQSTNIYMPIDYHNRNQNYSNCYGIYISHMLDKLAFANRLGACVINCESCFWLVNTKQLKNYGIFKREQTLHVSKHFGHCNLLCTKLTGAFF